jgi:glycosyltransferase involved in cell wall biosynthesis
MVFLIVASYPHSILKFRGELIQLLHSRGFEIHIAVPVLDDAPDVRENLIALGYTVHDIFMQRTGVNPIADGKCLLKLFLLMRKLKPDYVLGYTIKPVIYGSLAAFLARVPHRFALITGLGYAFQGMEDDGHRKSKLQKIVHRLYAAALATTQKVFFQNPDDLVLFEKMGIIKSDTQTQVVNGSGVNLTEYVVAPFKMKNDVPQPKFLLIARLLIDKGVREFAQAAQIIKNKYPHAEFDLVGWIDDNPNTIKQTELDLWVNQGLIRFWGKLTDIKPAVAENSIYVLPSYREGTPRTVLEAMAMGRPVITTDAPGCRETVIDGYNGFLVPIKSVDLLVEAMEKFILQPELITTMGDTARKVAVDKFDVNSVNQAMLKGMGL